MRILEYTGLDTSRVAATYAKVRDAIARDDFRAAQVKKLVNLSNGKFYRAKIDDANRLIFSLVRHGGEVCALMLEVVENHDYDRSRFLRGAAIDETKIPDADVAAEAAQAQPLRYLHPQRGTVHLLDKPISFDDAQDAIFRRAPPLVVVGSAGSGKTALTLEKLKHAEGEVLYVTHSAFLAQSARELYYANGFEHPGQDAQFLSYREFVESVRVPEGGEALWRDFAGWFARMQQAFRGVDAHQAFEEIRGVIAAQTAGVLTREQYRALGVRQSIFPQDERDRLYDLFVKYREWLAQAGLVDLNLLAHERLAIAAPRYDFVAIDEVQDITPVQLALVLATLKKPGHFVLCGDSNQIVHPNFFSWSQVKTLFWRDEALAAKQPLAMLAANFRNGTEATRVANALLKVKHRRFGSVDRESNFLVRAVGGEAGEVALLADRDAVTRDLDRTTRQTTRFAVLVMRDEDKAAARRHFATPLLFAIHEAKGLEYENIVLWRFVSDHRGEFAEIADGVTREDLDVDDLEYRRAKDKSDKSLEVYKFYVNALYVALTRAVKNLYLVESDTSHPLFGLLDLAPAGAVRVQAQASTLQDWQKEAHKLELQGKAEQAAAIRDGILKLAPVPWPVLDEARLRETLVRVFRDEVPGAKLRQQLYEHATCHDEPMLASALATDAKFDAARGFAAQRTGLARKHLVQYYAAKFKDVLAQCDRHGVDHRSPMNLTPLMSAAHAGNVALVDALLERGADPLEVDHYGSTALHWAMREAFRDPAFARGRFGALYERIAPSFVDVQAGGRLVRIDRHLSEYFLFQTFWALFKSRFTEEGRRGPAAFDAGAILAAWGHLPANVVPPNRAKRAHVSGVLARNEVERDYAYNRALFARLRQGWYQFNPRLAVRRGTGDAARWVPVYEALNLPLVGEMAVERQWERVSAALEEGGLAAWAMPIAMERRHARALAIAEEERRRQEAWKARAIALAAEGRRMQEERQARALALALAEEAKARHARRQAALERRAKEKAGNPTPAQASAPDAQRPAPWGTPRARQQEIERIRREIEAKRAAKKSGE